MTTESTPVEAVLFDLDDTLVRYRRSPGEVLAVAFDRVGVDPVFPVEAYYDRFDEFLARTDSFTELRRECFAALAAERDRDPDLGRAVADAFAAERDHAAVDRLPGVDDALSTLAADHRLGVVTNGPREAQAEKVAGAGLDEWMETVVFAGHETPAKPAPDPFERAVAELGVDAAAAVHVGDSPTSDVAGGRAAGLRTVLVGDVDGEIPHAPSWRVDGVGDLVRPPW